METWKDIIGYEGLYQISNMGRVRNKRTKKQLTLNTCNPYNIILIRKNGGPQKQFRVHRLVGLHFIPNPHNKPQINHKKGDRRDNRHFMLEWATGKENIQHASATGLRCHKGELNPMSKLSNIQRNEIIYWKMEGVSDEVLSENYKVHRATIISVYKNYLKSKTA